LSGHGGSLVEKYQKYKQKIRAKRRARLALWTSLLAGLALALSFHFHFLYPVAWVALVPLLLGMEKTAPRTWVLHWWLAGMAFFAVLLYWMAYVTLVAWIPLAITMSLWWVLLALLTLPLRKTKGAVFLAAFPAAWVAVEFLRSQGPYGFSWGLLAYSLPPELPLAQVVRWSGVWGLSFLVIAGNVALARAWAAKGWERFAAGGIVGVLAVALLLSPQVGGSPGGVGIQADAGQAESGKGRAVRVALVQPAIPQSKKWLVARKEDYEAHLFRLTERALATNPDIVIWPESAVQQPLPEDLDLLRRLRGLARERGAAFIVGSPYQAGSRSFNSAFYLNPSGALQRYDKLHLVPFGEYIPQRGVFGRIPQTDLVRADLSPGRGPALFALPGGGSVAPIICFESTDSILSRRATERAGLLVILTDDSWFGRSSAQEQHARMGRYRALELGIPVAQAANTGLSFVGDERGRILAQAPLYEEGVAQAIVRLRTFPTWYARLGDALPLGSVAALAFLALVLRVKIPGGKSKGKH